MVESHARGWKAFVDGEESQVLPANLGSIAVALPPGARAVRFTYRPASFTVGLLVSLMGSMLALGGLLRKPGNG